MADWADKHVLHDVQAVLSVVSGRWTLPVLAALQRGPLRHNELRREIEPIHHKVFNETLRRLTAQRLLDREVRQGTPPAVFYALSEPARSLMQELGILLNWVSDNPALTRHWREHAQSS